MEGYTTKEVLLAVKDKLSENDNKLKELSKLINYESDKRVKNVNFVMSEYNISKRPELYYLISLNKIKLNKIVKKTFEHFNMYRDFHNSGLVLRDNNGRSYFLDKKYNIFIPEENQSQFETISKELLDDEFTCKFLKSHYFYPAKKGINQNMAVFNNKVSIRGFINDSPILFDYNPGDNCAHLSNTRSKELSDSMLQELLSIDLDGEYFTDYRKSFIDSSTNKDKDIIIPKFINNTGSVDFEVKEEEKGLRLIKK